MHLKKVVKIGKDKLKKIIQESIRNVVILNENLFTHDDEYNLYEKLDELDIVYDYIPPQCLKVYKTFNIK